ncbi:MAG TPA: double zinc ribbon domain-containing protein, partial [Limnochordia bacterium]
MRYGRLRVPRFPGCVARALGRGARAVADWVQGPVGYCAACQRPQVGAQRPLCSRCLSLVPPLRPPQCRRCGRPLSAAQPLCAACFSSPPLFARGFPAGVYAGALKEWLQALKFGGRCELGPPLGALLALRTRGALRARLAGRRLAIDALVPIPLSAERLAQRGYNQARLIAAGAADRLG